MTSDFEEQLQHIAKTPIAWAFLLHFLQKCEGPNKFKFSGGYETFSKIVQKCSGCLGFFNFNLCFGFFDNCCCCCCEVFGIETVYVKTLKTVNSILAKKSTWAFHRVSLIWWLHELSYATCSVFIQYRVFISNGSTSFRSI